MERSVISALSVSFAASPLLVSRRSGADVAARLPDKNILTFGGLVVRAPAVYRPSRPVFLSSRALSGPHPSHAAAFLQVSTARGPSILLGIRVELNGRYRVIIYVLLGGVWAPSVTVAVRRGTVRHWNIQVPTDLVP